MSARLILASTSLRRARLLTDAGFAFATVAPDVDETPPPGTTPAEAAVAIARRKAEAVSATSAWILAADTVLDLDGAIGGKPRDADDARAILTALSGRTHSVATGVALRTPEGALHDGVEVTRVTFRALSAAEIDAYVRTGEPMDKAGAYAIQSGAAGFVERIDGPLDNVVGLPIGLVRALLDAAGHH